MADQPIPSTIQDWMQGRDWGAHHLRWHAERQWDLRTPAEREALRAQGWSRADRQEGAPGNGWDFLLMHRAMIEILKAEFPANASLFLGWTTPPTDPNDPADPVPGATRRGPLFDPNMTAAIDRLTNRLDSFASEDELGLYIQTRLRPIAGRPRNQTTDRSAGIHNYIHNRFSIGNSPINMGDPEVNLGNARFWRLHGWIDGRWMAFRRLKNLSDAAPDYVAALQAEKDSMLHPVGHPHIPLAAAARTARIANNRLALRSLPSAIRHPFRESAASRVQSLMESAPEIATKDELVAYLQTAIQVEHATLPLYLTAMWSLKEGAEGHREILLSVALQEMLHFGIVCNLLKAIGERPLIAPPDATIPAFPGQLPGLDLSDFLQGDIALESLFSPGADSKSRIKLFMRIERPEGGDIDARIGRAAAREIVVPRFHSIGEFYDVIMRGLETLADAGAIAFKADGQIGSGEFDALTPITTKEEALKLLNLIKEQGEGAADSQASGSAPEELAHYYRFKQILEEQKYNWATGKPVLDPARPLPFPAQDRVRKFTPASVGGHPESAEFDGAYSRMLDKLQEAWDQGNAATLRAGVRDMRRMEAKAVKLMDDHLLGPNFLYVPAAPGGGGPAPGGEEGGSAPPAPGAAIPGYARVREILDEAVNGDAIGAHGPFWRSSTRDEFVAKTVIGRPLLQRNSDGTFDPQESNLIKALEGRAPFGRDLTPRAPGAVLKRMPDGYPPVPQAKIDELRAWIGAGCPEIAPAAASVVDRASPAAMPVDAFVSFWRAFDNATLYQAPQPVRDDEEAFFAAAGAWFAFAADPSREGAWVAAIGDPGVGAGIRRLERLQRETIVQAFGSPARLQDMLACWEKFGDDSLPDDPLRPAARRHNMNGESMWFYWAAFADASARFSATDGAIPADFWDATGRAILLGLLNDGLFRGRFPVLGFPVTNAGKQAMREHVLALAPGALGAELRQRLVDSGLGV